MFGLCVRYLPGGLNDPLNDGLNHIHAPEAGWRNINFFVAQGVAATQPSFTAISDPYRVRRLFGGHCLALRDPTLINS